MRELSMFEVGLLIGRLGLTEESLDEILFGGKRYEIIEITEKYHDEPTLLADMDNSCDPEHFETSVKLPDEAFKTVAGNDVEEPSGEEFETTVQLPDEAFKTVTEEDDVPGLNDEMTEKDEPEFEEVSIGEANDIIDNPEELTDSWNGENKSTLLANKESGSEEPSSNPWITNKWETFE